MVLTDAELLERMNARVPATGVLLGFRMLALDSEKGWVRIAYDGKAEFCNPAGNVQGGIIAAMLDDTAALAAVTKARKRIFLPTLEFKTSFFAPARMGPLFAEGRCLKLGRRTAFMEADLFDAEERHLARMTVTAMPVPMPENPTFMERI